MDIYALHELLALNRALVSDTWNFFLTVHLAIFGIIYISTGAIRLYERVALLLAYGGFLYINFRAQKDNYDEQGSLVEAINAEGGSPIAMAGSDWIVAYLPQIYLCAAIVGAIIILSTNQNRQR